MNRKWFSIGCALLSILAVLVASSGCSTPGEKRLKRAANAYQKKGKYKKTTEPQYEAVMQHFEAVVDFAPETIDARKHRELVKWYRDSQINWGVETARQAAVAGEQLKAWYYLTQASAVSDKDERCDDAAQEAQKLQQEIAESYLADAERAMAAHRTDEAITAAARSMWYGGGHEAADLYCKAGKPAEPFDQLVLACPVHGTDIYALLRTDGYDRLLESARFAPYFRTERGYIVRTPKNDPSLGFPIYFGDVPVYYVKLGEVEVKGAPYMRKAGADDAREFEIEDSLWALTAEATRRKWRNKGVNAAINVRLWTKTKKSYTHADLVRILDLPDPRGQIPVVVTQIRDFPPPAPAPEPAVSGNPAQETAAEPE